MAEEAKNASAGGGQNKGMMLIIVAMLGLIIVALAGVAVFLIMNMGGDSEEGAGAAAQYTPDEPAEIPLYEQRMFVIEGNIFATLNNIMGGRTMVGLSVFTFGINNIDEEYADELYMRIRMSEPALISLITGIMRHYTIDQLEAPGGWEMLKRDILSLMQTEFNTNAVVEVYFTPIPV